MEQRNFYAALSHLNDVFGIEMKEELFENIALHAWDQIGNKNYRLYTFVGDTVNKTLALPCNVDIIEAVTATGMDVTRSTGAFNDTDYVDNQYIADNIERRSIKGEALYPTGRFIDYTLNDNTLEFSYDYDSVHVLYKGILVDDNGLPLLNFKEVDAIAKYCAYVTTQKQAMITKDKTTWDMAAMLRQQWQGSVDDARTPLYLNQNDMDNILNVQSSWDRKRFGLSFKVVK